MLKRLALVVWWIGSIVWILTALGCCYREFSQLVAQHRCIPILSEYANWQRKYDEAKVKYEAEHKKTSAAKTDEDLGDLDEWLALDTAMPMPTALSESYQYCQKEDYKTYWFALLAASVFTLLAFSLAFVFGGRFWLPPKLP